MKEEKTRMKFLIINDIHNRIQNVRKVISKVKSEKFDYVLCCGNIITLPTGDNADKNRIESLIPVMKSIFLEIENIAPIIWVPGNHDAYSFFTNYFEEISSKSQNIHKKFKKIANNLYIVGLGGSTPILTGGRWNKDFIPFQDMDFSQINYPGYPYNADSNDYIESDKMLLDDLNEVLNEGKKTWENSQLIFLTHTGPLFSFTNSLEEEGDYLYLGSNNLGQVFKNEQNSLINIHGHSHFSEGFETLRPGKYIFNPGANYNGNYGKLEIMKNKEGKWDVLSNSIEYV